MELHVKVGLCAQCGVSVRGPIGLITNSQYHNHIQPEKPKEAEVYGDSKEAKQNGWFSRRHETEEAHRASGETRRVRKARLKNEAEIRAAERADRSDEEQLALLESRGHGHCGEAVALRNKIG